jgi:hypothetical protein
MGRLINWDQANTGKAANRPIKTISLANKAESVFGEKD